MQALVRVRLQFVAEGSKKKADILDGWCMRTGLSDAAGHVVAFDNLNLRAAMFDKKKNWAARLTMFRENGRIPTPRIQRQLNRRRARAASAGMSTRIDHFKMRPSSTNGRHGKACAKSKARATGNGPH